MKKNLYNNKISEYLIVNKYLNKLNLNKEGTYNFRNDASYISLHKNKKIVVTTDSISENIDFFKGDDPKSIANKILTVNLSDLSAMGAEPHSYLLNLFIPSYIDESWIKIFTNELFKFQKKYKFYLLGGDLSSSKILSISSTFLGMSKYNKIVPQNRVNINDDIWITGNIGDSYVGLQILKKKISVNKNYENYFIKKYFYPKPFIKGVQFSKFVNSMKDISDGLIGDLKKMLNYKFGAQINLSLIPLSPYLNKLIRNKIIKYQNILNCGDNYDLIIISNCKYRKKIYNTAKKNNVKIFRIGKVIKNREIIDDSKKPLIIPREFDHFL